MRAQGVTGAALALVAVAVGGCGSSDGAGGGKAPAGARTLQFKLTDANGCEPKDAKAAAGPTTFMVSNDDAVAVTELELLQGSKIVGEVENVAAGLDKHFTVTLKPGTYKLACPGGDGPGTGTLPVSGSVPSASGAGAPQAARTYRR
jgi:iron uptake system component EfeO